MRQPELAVGSIAPDFTLPTHEGSLKSLADFLALGPLLLAFHRGTWWPNCRRQFGELAHDAVDYLRHGVQVAAIVAQRSEKVRRYYADRNLPFTIMIDDSRDTVKAYGVWHPVGLDAWNIARPALFLIDRDGVVRYSFVASWQFEFVAKEEILRAITQNL